jgi:hypothetical protein
MAPIFIDDAVGGACCDIVADGGRRRRGTGTLEGVWGGFLCQFLPQSVERKPRTMRRGWRGGGVAVVIVYGDVLERLICRSRP